MDYQDDDQGKNGYLDKLAIRSGSRTTLVPTEEIDWIEAAANYVRIHAGADQHLLRETITRIEAGLDPSRFVRIHRSRIVNLRKIRGLESLSRGGKQIVLQDGTRLKLSRGQKGKLPALTSAG
jgi:two-component system LytT family response regulator